MARALPEVHFVWIGEGEQRALLDAPNIEITGWVSREQALRRAMEGNVFLLTSRWEGLPMSLLESMYLGKTCAVSDAAGNREVIRTGGKRLCLPHHRRLRPGHPPGPGGPDHAPDPAGPPGCAGHLQRGGHGPGLPPAL